jgi:hypothetical protein
MSASPDPSFKLRDWLTVEIIVVPAILEEAIPVSIEVVCCLVFRADFAKIIEADAVYVPGFEAVVLFALSDTATWGLLGGDSYCTARPRRRVRDALAGRSSLRGCEKNRE